MTCKYCNGKLAPLRSLTDGEFCSDDHRHAYFDEHPAEAVEEAEFPLTTAFDAGLAPFAPPPAESSAPSGYRVSFAPQEPVPPVAAPPEAVASAAMLADVQPSAAEPVEPPRFLTADAEQRSAREGNFFQKIGFAAKREVWRSGNWLVTAWKTAPIELKAMALLLPVLLALACSPLMPTLRAHVKAEQASALRAQTREALSNQWKVVSERISDRAAIAITDDFRAGLDAWESRSNLTTSWSFDTNGFVQPGPLAVLKPTRELTDYSFEFLGEIQRKALGAAFRARDLENFYAVKFVQDDSGPLPGMRLIRYAVINGREGPHVERKLQSSIRSDMFNRFRVEAHGSDFTILVQDEVVDFFSDQRLSSGAVGFFCSRGEKARLRWVEVSHQYDTLGKLCAFFSPVNLAGVSKQ